jgi:plasmid stability protein
MASLIIRGLGDGLKSRLRLQAAQNGRSMEAEAREILRLGLTSKPSMRTNLANSIRRRLAPLGGVDLPPFRREALRPPPKLT